jgi:hypothetical protein
MHLAFGDTLNNEYDWTLVPSHAEADQAIDTEKHPRELDFFCFFVEPTTKARETTFRKRLFNLVMDSSIKNFENFCDQYEEVVAWGCEHTSFREMLRGAIEETQDSLLWFEAEEEKEAAAA